MKKIGIIGHGTVGKALYSQLKSSKNYQILGIAEKEGFSDPQIPKDRITYNAFELIQNPETEVILEAINHPESAFAYAMLTLELGKTYITANKKMVALHLPQLIETATIHGSQLYYEAAVGGAIPVLQTLRNYYQSEPIQSVRGIVNGSCNYILTRMLAEQESFADALKLAQELGFAESDPSLDVDGWDSLFKTILLAWNAFGVQLKPEDVELKGISHLRYEDLVQAQEKGGKIKLIASIHQNQQGLSASVTPTLILPNDPLFSVDNETNAIEIKGKFSHDIVLQGPGAGGDPTAAAMVADLNFQRSMVNPV